jgi:hypothetical protein
MTGNVNDMIAAAFEPGHEIFAADARQRCE